MYVNDNDGGFPAYANEVATPIYYWYDTFTPYIKSSQIFLCPVDSALYGRSNGGAYGVGVSCPWAPATGVAPIRCSYGANTSSGVTDSTKIVFMWATAWANTGKIDAMVAPSNTIMLGDSKNYAYLQWIAAPRDTDVAYVHNDVANIGFCDGHVKPQAKGSLPSTWWTKDAT